MHTDPDTVIPVKQLVFYSHKKVGAAWEGQSVLRPTYRPWAMKDMYLRLDLSAVERNSSGYWIGKTADVKRRDQLFEALGGLRNGDESTLVIDPQDSAQLVSLNGSPVNILDRLKYLDQEIGKSALAMFMDLGHDAGAKALGETHLRVFYTKVKALAEYIARTITLYVIRDLVRLNFPEGTPYPILTPGDIVAQQGASADTIHTLMASGSISYDRGLEDYVRAKNGLPALPEDWVAPDPTPKQKDPQNTPQIDSPQNVVQAAERVDRLYQQLKESLNR